ncbi:transferase [Dolichospermum circinale CS-1225]|uniref:Transferase n=1 Tax=Dolichospermum circinale CS-537/01 TaxID=3021739 RepID=A0ABT5A6Z7_9CYAN|nr:transferase [Dolichospermum circinale]MDB9460079.1 transferase [Dolichospermum circinale CS-545/17]MDB9465948.1 transferase [Dolichospermum circinale CS-539/09]MDB9471088.1 transferase [Dolichospermum circinale CS-539]MDB9487448.1 transferase [Dolichospermum circinale CS-537/01]MDB9521545.1 transferase [Dolichospermum circinale CS-1225]
MSISLLQLSDRFDTHIYGDVIIHPSAVLAPGIILQAATNSRIVIGAGVCLGMGSILQVSEGILEIEAGANLGAGFLMVGQGKIGANACIGAATTVFNYSVAPGQVIASGSILGDTSRQVVEASAEEPESSNSQPEKPEKQEQVISSTQLSVAAFLEFKHQSTPVSPPSPTPKSQSPPVEETAVISDSTSEETKLPQSTEECSDNLKPSESNLETHNIFGTQIYGQGSINRLLSTLFPHRQSLGNQNSENSSG